MSEAELLLVLERLVKSLKPNGQMRIYTKSPDDDLIVNSVKINPNTYTIQVGYERGMKQFVPNAAWWHQKFRQLDINGNLSVETGYDKYNYVGKKANSFLVFTLTNRI